ncbi:probable glutathione S-transferase GSTU1 [Oryza brachyantha]|uniref:Glutathione S-transferase n=1 Tax=Oryza brachyantha TaxID=4533 RepID=J3MKP5_ORYBR|nr:probable glutathione S-transferase GSTU1 [Oryza brachyantha]
MAAAAAAGGLVLLDFWVSPFGQRCRIALAEKKLPYEYSEQELLGAKSELLLRSNPVHKKIPVLLHGGAAVCESLVILEYLDDAFPDTPRLLPAGDPYARAWARFWGDYVDTKVYPVGTRLWKLGRAGEKAEARAELVEALRTLDGELGERRFFGGGDAFGFVDVALVPLMPWVQAFARYGEFSVEEECPRVAAWARRCMERDSVAKSLRSPEEVYDFIGLLRNYYGVRD